MKKMLVVIAMIAMFTSAAAAQEKKDNAGKPGEPIGLSFGMDYFSNYLWRGTKFFSGDGAFIPKVAWNIPGSGLVLSVAGEISSSWVFNGFSKKPGKYDYRIDSSGGITRRQLNFNHAAYATQSLDFGADYSCTIKDAVTIGVGAWYWWYFNSQSEGICAAAGGRPEPGVVRRHQLPDDNGHDRPPDCALRQSGRITHP